MNDKKKVKQLPYEIKEALIRVCGKCFWYKRPFFGLLVSVGVEDEIIQRYKGETKYIIARSVIAELERQGDDGYLILRRLLTTLCNLRKPPDENIPDRDGAVTALRELKGLALRNKLVVESEKEEGKERQKWLAQMEKEASLRRQQLAELRERYIQLLAAEDHQLRGYALQDLIKDLFELNEIPYKKSYRTKTEEIDGHFRFEGFDYLVEARWREKTPNEQELSGFKGKVDRKITSTRGLFISVTGFRTEVVEKFTSGVKSNIILMDGQDLQLILEGQFLLVDAIQAKAEKAAQEGIIFFPLRKLTL